MEAIIFCGLQASGKTTFYLQHFFKTHVRISLDQLHTRRKEKIFIQTCLNTQQRFVIDNTNPARTDRNRYITWAREHKFSVTGYFFNADIIASLKRNANRIGKEKIPVAGLRGTFKKLEPLAIDEGFDKLFYVDIADNSFNIQEQFVRKE
jgi:predicted kinase